VLDVGTGTGACLDAFPHDSIVLGVDQSMDMLRQAQKRVRRKSWDHIQLVAADAGFLPFPDDRFNIVTAFHSLTAMSDPHRALQEMCRVCTPTGRILLVGHFPSRSRCWSSLCSSLDAVTRRLGWRAKLSLDELVESVPATVLRQSRLRCPLFTEVVMRPHEDCGDRARSRVVA